MDVLGSRMLLHTPDPARSQDFYRDVLGLAVYRQFGDPAAPGLVFFIGGGFLEVTGGAPADQAGSGVVSLWLQVRDIQAEYRRLEAAGVPIVRAPRREPWGLDEMWIDDPDGVPIVLVEVPPDHPIRIDIRSL
jgi:catechol 2,3-dioxygenase-like lactoylglutathione lyase family enzyme